MKPLSSCTYAELKERAQKRISELDDTDGYTPGPIIYAHAAGYALAAADLPTALCQLEILADKIHDTQRKIDLATANDALILDTFDLMATYGCARDTIRVRMRKGIIPPPLDRVGGRFRWTAGYLREWDLLRAKRAIEALSKMKPSAKLNSTASRSEFD